ncbi:MAG: SelB C-terminal domain-containing protein, partial [Planctomycetaceae bacterium]
RRSLALDSRLSTLDLSRRRTALNLASIKSGEIARGMELATPGYLHPTRRLVVRLRSLASSPITLKNRQELSLHLATAETTARLVLKDRPIQPGETGFAELRLHEPVVAAWGQRFILRRPSPAATVAGGVVLDPDVPPEKRLRDLAAHAAAMESATERDRLSFVLSQRDSVPASPQALAARTGVAPVRYEELIEELRRDGGLVEIDPIKKTHGARPAGSRMLVHSERLAALTGAVLRTVKAQIAAHQPRRALPVGSLMTACRDIAPPEIIETVFGHLLRSGELVEVGETVGPADAQPQLTKRQRQTREGILKRITDAALAPPTVGELAALLDQPPAEIEPLLTVLVEDGLLVKVSDLLYFTPAALEQARRICAAILSSQTEATLSELREAWGVTRKFAVPLCEHFDATGVTVRKGDLRAAGPRIGQPFDG